MEQQKEKTENEAKKDYLREYAAHVRRATRIADEIEELRNMKMYPSVKQSDGMPHGSSSSNDLSGYAAVLTEKIEKLQVERIKRIESYEQIQNRIEQLSDETERDLLFYRYIKLLDWWEIAEKMKYSERHLLRLHGKALKHLKI